MPATLSASDVAAFAGFWSWYQPSREAHSEAYRALGYDNVQAIDKEVYALSRIKAIEAFDTTVAIKVHMLTSARQRGSIKPERVDYTGFFKGAVAKRTTPYMSAMEPYKPEPGASGVKLQPAAAVRISSTQESYSDDSAVAVPFTVDASKPADMEVFARNVHALVRRADSHNGMAGSGCNYGLSVHDGFVVINCRASIAD